MTEKKKILIVDDEPDMVKMVKMGLEAAGYEVLEAFDGQEGFEKAKSEKPDLVIMDLMLPKMDGYKVCGLLKKDTRYARIPVIIFTAKAHDDDVELGKELGANAYITKPFDLHALLSKIKKLLGE